MKRPESRTRSVTYHNKALYQVSVQYIKGYGRKVKKKTTGATNGRTDGEQKVPSGKSSKRLLDNIYIYIYKIYIYIYIHNTYVYRRI